MPTLTPEPTLTERVELIFTPAIEALNDAMIDLGTETGRPDLILDRYIDCLVSEVSAMRVARILVGGRDDDAGH